MKDKISNFSDDEMHGRRTKIDQFKWQQIEDEPGVFMMINKSDLNVDKEHYQRIAANNKVLGIASSWSWISCGSLAVGMRPDGGLWVIDGQHRKAAADKRADIRELPCIVFEVESIGDEAQAFLDINTARRPLRSSDKFKAQIVVGDELTILAKRLIDQTGRIISQASSPTSFACFTTLTKCLEKDADAIERMWPVLRRITDGHAFHKNLLEAIFYIEMRLSEGESLSDKRWASRLEAIGCEELRRSIQKAHAFYGKGGAKIYAEGVLQAINVRLRSPLKLGDRYDQ